MCGTWRCPYRFNLAVPVWTGPGSRFFQHVAFKCQLPTVAPTAMGHPSKAMGYPSPPLDGSESSVRTIQTLEKLPFNGFPLESLLRGSGSFLSGLRSSIILRILHRYSLKLWVAISALEIQQSVTDPECGSMWVLLAASVLGLIERLLWIGRVSVEAVKSSFFEYPWLPKSIPSEQRTKWQTSTWLLPRSKPSLSRRRSISCWVWLSTLSTVTRRYSWENSSATLLM